MHSIWIHACDAASRSVVCIFIHAFRTKLPLKTEEKHIWKAYQCCLIFISPSWFLYNHGEAGRSEKLTSESNLKCQVEKIFNQSHDPLFLQILMGFILDRETPLHLI